MKGCLFKLVGPAGVGKNKILEGIQNKYPNLLTRAISATTRYPRIGEINGKDYHFKTTEEFIQLIRDNKLIEHNIHIGKYYGTPISSIIPILDIGENAMKIINTFGIRSLKESSIFNDYKHIVIFINSPSREESERRLRTREDINMTEEEIQERMLIGDKEIQFYKDNNFYFDHYIINDILEETVEKIARIINNSKTYI